MLSSYKKIAPTFILVALTIFFLSSLAIGKEAEKKPTKQSKTELKNKVLVSGDIGRSTGAWPISWCGNKAILAYSKKSGIELIMVPSGDRIIVSTKKDDYPFNCSPDGKWVVYVDRASTRLDKSEKTMTAKDYGLDPGLDLWPVWEGYVDDLYRFNVETGQRQKFAVVRSELPAWEVISPDGVSAFLGGVHNSTVNMPEQSLEVQWLSPTKNPKNWSWGQSEAKWFKDSSGVVIPGSKTVDIEVFGDKNQDKKGWAKRFAIAPEPADYIRRLSVKKNNDIYFIAPEVELPNVGKFFLYHCTLSNTENKDLSCLIILKTKKNIISYELLPNGEVLFTESNDHCIRRIYDKQADPKCVTEGQNNSEVYIIGLSPNEKWLAFETNYKLFIIEVVTR